MGYSVPYIFWFIVMLLLGGLEIYSKEKKTIQWLECICFIVFFGCRAYVGTDWVNYLDFYNTSALEVSITDGAYEPGFILLCQIFRSVDLNFFFLASFIVILQAILFQLYFSRHVKYMFLTYILLISIFPSLVIDTLRNFLSLLLVLISIESWKNNRRYKGVFFLILSYSFHVTGPLIFFVFLFCRSYLSRRLISYILLIAIPLYFLQIRFVSSLLTFIGELLPGRMGLLLAMYSQDSIGAVGYGISLGIIEKFFFIGILIWQYHKVIKLRIVSPFVFNSFCVYVFLNLFFTELPILIERFAVLFFYGYIILLSNLPYVFFRKSNRRCIIIILIFLSFVKVSISYDSVLYEYNTFFNYNEMERRKMEVSDFYKRR